MVLGLILILTPVLNLVIANDCPLEYKSIEITADMDCTVEDEFLSWNRDPSVYTVDAMRTLVTELSSPFNISLGKEASISAAVFCPEDRELPFNVPVEEKVALKRAPLKDDRVTMRAVIANLVLTTVTLSPVIGRLAANVSIAPSIL